MGLGGAQRHLASLVSGLDPKRFRAAVYCLLEGGELADELRARGIPVTVLGLRRIYGLRALRGFLRLVGKLRAEKTSILHTYLASANIFGAAAAAAARVPCLLTTRRDLGFSDGRLIGAAQRLTNLRARRVIVVSEEVARRVRTREALQAPVLMVIGNGVDLDRFSPRNRRAQVRATLGLSDGARLVVALGHFTHIKGFDLLARAAVSIRSAVPEAVFFSAGTGDRDSFARHVRELDLSDCFLLSPPLSDVPPILEAADLFVLPSRSEGVPNAVLEAMAMGLPIVASRVGGVPEILRDGEEGLLVEPGEHAPLASACIDLLRSPMLARRLGQAARARAEAEFGLETIIHRYEQLYEELCPDMAGVPLPDESSAAGSG